MTDRICVVTGANAGIGKATATTLAKKQDWQIILVCRSETRGKTAQQEIIQQTGNTNVTLMLCDLSSQASIRQFVNTFRQTYNRIDVLINNAGALFQQRTESVDGLEMTFALNHLGYFMLTLLLLDLIKAGNQPRIINVSSGAHAGARDGLDFDDLQFQTRNYSAFPAYAASKLANIYFTTELARRVSDAGITVNALHPGFVASNFGKNNSWLMRFIMNYVAPILGRSTDKGAETVIYLATAPEVTTISGQYFSDKKVVQTSDMAQNDTAAQKLWQMSLALTKIEDPT